MINDNDEKYYYFAVKSKLESYSSEWLESNGCFHSYCTLDKLKKHEKVCNNHDYCHIDMPKKHEKIKFLRGEKSLKAPFIMYADLECILKKNTISSK